MDLYAVERTTIKPGRSALIGTGIACHLPRGHVGLIWDKSGLATSHGLKVMGGVIDEGYRGEIKVGLMNLGAKTVTFEAGHKIAQMLVQRVHQPKIRIVTALAASQRGIKGFGSTGK